MLSVANRKVYGAHKLWKAARRPGHDIGRDQVARLMRELGIKGVSRRRKVFTTRQDPDALRAPDLVNRHFTAGGNDERPLQGRVRRNLVALAMNGWDEGPSLVVAQPRGAPGGRCSIGAPVSAPGARTPYLGRRA